MRQLLTSLIIVTLGSLLVFCGAETDGVDYLAGDDSGETPGTESSAAGDGDVTDDDFADSDDSAEIEVEPSALVEDVRIVVIHNPDIAGNARYLADDDGCAVVPFVAEEAGRQQFCFSNPAKEPHLMTLLDGEGGEVLYLAAGQGCAIINLAAGVYDMELCHAGGGKASRSGMIFMAKQDIAGVTSVAPDWLPEDGVGYESDYDYEDGEGTLYTVTPLFVNTVKFNNFLSTGVCSYCDLRAADFVGSDSTLPNVTLTGSDMSGAIFYDDTDNDLVVSAGDTAVDFSSANLSKARFDDAVMDLVDFTGATLTSASLKRATLSQATFANTNLTRARLDDTDITSANFTLANLTRARLNGADATGATFTNAGMASAVVEDVNFTNAVMQGVNLQGAKCGEADFTNANLSTGAANANLNYAYFNNALMTNVNLTNASLTKARFNEADMTGATFNGATGTTGTSKAIFRNTILTSATWVAAEVCEIPPDVSYYDPVTQECEQ